MVKAILFDFWGTLAEQGVWSLIKQVKTVLEIDLPFSEYVVRMEKTLMTKEFPTLKEAFTELCQEFEIAPSPEKIEELIGLWNKSWMLAKPYPETIETLSRLREKYRIILISNTDCFSINHVLEKFKLNILFDQIFFSYQLGMIKTDKLFLKTILKQLNLNSEDCLLVGDSIQSDIMAAKMVSLPAVLIDRRNTRDYQPKINNLSELESFIDD